MRIVVFPVLIVLILALANSITDRFFDIDGDAANYVSEIRVIEAAKTAEGLKKVNECTNSEMPLKVRIACLQKAQREYKETMEKLDVLGSAKKAGEGV